MSTDILITLTDDEYDALSKLADSEYHIDYRYVHVQARMLIRTGLVLLGYLPDSDKRHTPNRGPYAKEQANP